MDECPIVSHISKSLIIKGDGVFERLLIIFACFSCGTTISGRAVTNSFYFAARAQPQVIAEFCKTNWEEQFVLLPLTF